MGGARRVLVGFLLALLAFYGIAQAVTFVVNSTGDGVDCNLGDGICNDGMGNCTLRAAIEQANAYPGKDTIKFSIPTSDPGYDSGTGAFTIQPASPLPSITDPVIIDGSSQPGFAGTPIIELDGSNAGSGANGLEIIAGNSTVKGLVINRFASDGPCAWDPSPAASGGHGVVLRANGSNIIEGNFIGTDVTGTIDLGNSCDGVLIEGVPNNTIGGTTAAARNVISGNGRFGVNIYRSGATGNTVQGNFIGIAANGTAALGNSSNGVYIRDTSNNTIGGTTEGAGNIISCNHLNGVLITDSGATGNMVQGNYIGTDVTGTLDRGNTQDGVFIYHASNNTIGGTTDGARNVVSGNDRYGILISDSGATGNNVQGNFIGTDVTGISALSNSYHGVIIAGAPNNTIGGTTDGTRNVISANSRIGVYLFGNAATGNKVQGNFIGTDVTGTAALGNAFEGVFIDAPNNTIGGMTEEARNVISDNFDGIKIQKSWTQVQGNFIGTDVTGTSNLGNTHFGVYIYISSHTSLVGNTIAFNGSDGVCMNQGTDNTFLSNTIASNGQDGLTIYSGTGHFIFSNSIHSNTELGIDLGNDGVTLNDAGDGDTGPNNLQNFPVLTSATSGNSTIIEGTLNSTPNTKFCIAFFSNSACDPTGYGEGEQFLNDTEVRTNASGNASFTVTLSTTVPGGRFITATATDPSDNTSEFCACIQVQTPAVFRVDRTGDVLADGAFYGAGFHTGSADVAEWVPVSEPVEPGDVLEFDPNRAGHYRKSRGPCSNLVAGVVSTEPGFVLGTNPSTLDFGLSASSAPRNRPGEGDRRRRPDPAGRPTCLFLYSRLCDEVESPKWRSLWPNR